MKQLWTLFVTFMRVGAFTFGGGYAMMPILQREVVQQKKWATEEEVLDYYAVGQCTPGIIAVNTATFIGHKIAGIPGAVVATAGLVFPSLVIITILAAVLQQFADYPLVAHALVGIRVAVAALVVQAVYTMWKSGVKDGVGIALFVITFAGMVVFNLSPLWFVVFGILVGVCVSRLKAKKSGDRSKGGKA